MWWLLSRKETEKNCRVMSKGGEVVNFKKTHIVLEIPMLFRANFCAKSITNHRYLTSFRDRTILRGASIINQSDSS